MREDERLSSAQRYMGRKASIMRVVFVVVAAAAVGNVHAGDVADGFQENNCSLSEAQRILWEPRGGQASPWSDSTVKTPQKRSASENIADEAKLSASPSGYKPLDGDENVQACVVNLKPGAGGSVLMCCPAQGLRDFSLDYVLDETSGQQEAYDAVAGEQVDHFLSGNDVCIFAYGQTGSGKTHSMFGPGGTLEGG